MGFHKRSERKILGFYSYNALETPKIPLKIFQNFELGGGEGVGQPP